MQGWRLNTVAIGNRFQCGQFSPRQRAGFSPSRFLQYLFQQQNSLLGNEHPRFAEVFSLRFSPRPVMDNRLPFDGKVKAEAGHAALGPIPHGRLGHAFDDLRCLPRVKKPLAGLLVNVGRRFHPGRLPDFASKIIRKVQGGRGANETSTKGRYNCAFDRP